MKIKTMRYHYKLIEMIKSLWAKVSTVGDIIQVESLDTATVEANIEHFEN